MNSYSELKADIDKLRLQLMLLGGAVGSGNLAALGNWVQYSGVQGSPTTRQPVPGTQTGDGTHTPVVAAAVLKTGFTGIYKVSASISFTDSAANPADITQLVAVTAPGPGVLSSSGTGGFVAAGTSGTNALNASSGLVGGDQGSSDGLSIDGVTINSLVAGSPELPRNGTGVQPITPTSSSGLYHWSYEGLISNGSKVKTPWHVGDVVCFALQLQIPNGNVMKVGHCAIGAIEWPFG